MSDGLDFTPPQNNQPRDTLIPRFYLHPEKNNFRSTQEGREVFEEHEFIEILIPGDKNSIVQRHVKDDDRARWSREYQAFKAGMEAPLEGTPVDQWAAIGPAQAMELKAANVKTVDALAQLSDTLLAKVAPIGGHALREKARNFLEQAEKNAPNERLQAAVMQKDAEIADLQRQLSGLATQFTEFKDKVHAES